MKQRRSLTWNDIPPPSEGGDIVKYASTILYQVNKGRFWKSAKNRTIMDELSQKELTMPTTEVKPAQISQSSIDRANAGGGLALGGLGALAGPWGMAGEALVSVLPNIISAVNGYGERESARQANKYAQDQMILSNQLTTDLQNKAAAHQANYFNMTAKYNSPEEQVKRLKAAGLNPALAYTGATGAGGSGQTGSAPSGTTGAVGAQKANIAGAQAASNQQVQQLATLAAQLENIKADTELKRTEAANVEVDTEKKGEEAETVRASREAIVKEIRERGEAQWIENIVSRWRMSEAPVNPEKSGVEGEMLLYRDELYGAISIHSNSLMSTQEATRLLETYMAAKNMQASAWLQNEKAANYFTEMMNRILQGNAAAARDSARALADNWGIGEYTNWKTWVDTGLEVLGGVAGAVGSIKGTAALPGKSSSTTKGNFETRSTNTSTSTSTSTNTNYNYNYRSGRE